MAIKKVAVAGVSAFDYEVDFRPDCLTYHLKATGNVGMAILKALDNSDQFHVTALIRSGSATKTELPTSINVIRVDYSNTPSLVEALRGQDAVVSALNHTAFDHQRSLLDASVSAGVQRFIPSEYGSDTLNEKAAVLPLFASKKVEQRYIKELADRGKIGYTLVTSGPFIDLGLQYGFLGPDLKKKQFTYVDGGTATFSTTRLASVGQAVVGVLSKPDETKNRAVYVQEAALSQRDLFKLAKQALGDDGWTEIDGGTTQEIEKISYEKFANGQKDMGVMIGFLMSAIIREGYGGHFHKLDNELLGIEELKEAEIVELIQDIARYQAT